MYIFMSIVTQKFATVPPPQPSSSSSTVTSATTTTSSNANNVHGLLANFENKRPLCIWKAHTITDLHVFVTNDSKFQDPYTQCQSLLARENNHNSHDSSSSDMILGQWHQTDLVLDSLDPMVNYKRDNITISIPKSVQYNETQIYAHVCLMTKHHPMTTTDNNDDWKGYMFYKSFPLTRYKLRKRKRDEKNLLESVASPSSSSSSYSMKPGDENTISSPLTIASSNSQSDAILLYLKPSLTLQLVDMAGMMTFPHRKKIPLPILSHMDWLNETSSRYYPLLYSSEFWITSDKLIPINDTISQSTIQITLEQIKFWKWQLMSQMEETWRKQSAMNAGIGGGGAGGQDDDEGTDMFRTMLLETNPILLAITAIVTVLHSVFDFLAFKNDIKFFKNKKSMAGLSLRSMVVNTLFQMIILLYLVDNETSFMVIVSNGVGVAIEVWKISKAVKISLWDGHGKFKIEWKETESYTTSKTKEYDEIATDHLMFVTMPLVCGYGMYSLFHQKHKGWYSWILNTLVGFIYMFGFVMMTPQLFINYKLQSVAHLNWRTMTYKSINTFIDDLFAFVIKMPIMHRLACLRDDVIFLIFCYQRWKYRVDYSRVNEYGQCEDPNPEEESITGGEGVLIPKSTDEVVTIDDAAGKLGLATTQDRKKRRGARDKRT